MSMLRRDDTLALTVLRECAAEVEAFLDGLYREGGRCDAALGESVRYSLMAGGKRVRPALVLEFCRLFGGDIRDAVPFAAAVEIIHSASLIHDDLPCMDDDDLRRGRPTNHKVYGEAMALLAGDSMFMDAFALTGGNDRVPAKVRAEATVLLSRAAGYGGMVRGQVVDMFGEQNQLSYDELLYLHANKTGALIRVSAQLGCLAAGVRADSPCMKAAEGDAERIGLAFQVVDDTLDGTSTPEALGNSVGGDAEHHKNTFLSFHALDEASDFAKRLTHEAVELIEGYTGADRLAALAHYLAVRKT